MKYKNCSLKIVACLYCALMLPAIAPVALAQDHGFPFFRSFLDNNVSGIDFLGPNDPYAYYDEPNKYEVNRLNKAKLRPNYGLQLTENVNDVGAFFLPNNKFSTQDGLLIEFEYLIKWSGGGVDAETDGIAMFLVDAKDKYIAGGNLKYGAEGAGFGYTYNHSTFINKISGIKGGYLAVALDNMNFKSARFDSREYRNGIFYRDDYTTPNVQDVLLDTKSNVTIRGAAGQGSQTIKVSGKEYNLAEGFWGYPVLVTRHSGKDRLGNTNLHNAACFVLNTTTGDYFRSNLSSVTPSIPDGDVFDMAGQSIDVSGPQDPAYRKAIITLEPNTTGGGFKISVKIQSGQKEVLMIKDFTFPETITYQENAYPTSSGGISGTKTLVTYTVPTPEKLVIGFGASTGTKTPYTNIIRNLRITPMYAAESNNDIYTHRRGPAIVRPLDNDKAYASGTGMSTDNIDPSSLRFWKDEYNLIAGHEIYIPGQGHWSYIPSKREVMFFPEKGFSGVARLMYDIKGKAPYNDERFRSSLAHLIIVVPANSPVK